MSERHEFKPEMLTGPAYVGMTPQEYNALQAVVAAVRAAGGWPLLRHETFMDGDWYLECFHCGANNAVSGGEVDHEPTCPGVVLANALAQLDGVQP